VAQSSSTYTYSYRCNGNSSRVNAFGCESDRVSQTINGVTTHYVVDSAAPLSQVLSDGTDNYLYGNGLLAQDNGVNPEYFLSDGLGSIRQLVDASGNISLSQSFDPYGQLVSKNGTGSSVFGFTGEQMDSSLELVYLRSRYYSDDTGRFITKDNWRGNSSKPTSYNAWLYGYSNPITYTDPSGNIPTWGEIENGNQVYSCNCGFIDFSHANANIGMSIYELLEQYKDQLRKAPNNSRQDVFAISPYTSAALVGKQTITAVVTANDLASDFLKDGIAHGIYRSLASQVEIAQGNMGLWFTHYSFEDLASDEIGYYMAKTYKKRVDARDDDTVWSDLAEICDFPKDRGEARRVSEEVWKNAGGILWYLKTPQVREWGSPLLFCVSGICKNGNGKWPTQISSMPLINNTYSRDGGWWIYNQGLDGELIDSDYSGFNFIKRGN
jgi:RHS repeat-associated protein